MVKTTTVFAVGLVALALASGAEAKGSTQVLGKSNGFTYAKATGKVSPAKEVDKVFAKCPGKTESIGGGSSLGTKQDGAYISESSGWDPDGWFTSAHQSSGASVKVTSWAVCAKGEKIKRYRDDATAGAGNPFYHSIQCDQGAAITGGNHTEGPIENWILSQSFSFAVDAHLAAVFNQGPTAALTAEVICIKDFEDLRSEYDTYSGDSQVSEFSVSCRTSDSVVGGGYANDGLADETHILETRPVDNLSDDNKVPDDGWLTTSYNDAGETFTYEVAATCR